MKTFLDSGVLLMAWKGAPADAIAAQTLMEDEQRQFVTSQMVKLELLPKPAFFRNDAETEFYQSHFDQATAAAPLNGDAALDLAKRYGLAAADALNLQAAIDLEAAEFVTSELPGKPLFRVQEIRVTTLHAAVHKTPAPPVPRRSR